MSGCFLCPRACGADRSERHGICSSGDKMKIARADLHFFEEPPISGERGSGTVFFCGCSLRCVFCQNRSISRGGDLGREVSVSELADIMLSLEERGAHNINLVTGAHFVPEIVRALEIAKKSLKIPIVYNSSGYELASALRMLDGLVDIYLPDYKYVSSELSAKYSGAEDYSEIASAALCEMFSQVGEVRMSDSGIMERGMIVRHLVLPSCRADSIAVVRKIYELFGNDKVMISIMSQYTPEFALESEYKNLHRKITKFEYESVKAEAEKLGFSGFYQAPSSATSSYTPEFK